GLAHVGTQIRALGEACADAGVPGPWALAPTPVVERLELGNVVLAAGGALRSLDPAALRAAGPHPAAVLDEHAAAALTERVRRS
ncbi:spermidine synthase, partial [Micrococcus endophyticus]